MKKSIKITVLLPISFVLLTQIGFAQKSNSKEIKKTIPTKNSSNAQPLQWKDWEEYMFWAKNNLKAEEYQKVLPDSNSVSKFYGKPYSSINFKDENVQNSPVIGITQKQANDYAKWKMDQINGRETKPSN